MSNDNHPDAKPYWTEMDLFDLANCIRLGDSVEEIADFLSRPLSEVHCKIVELTESGELGRRLAKLVRKPVVLAGGLAGC